MMLRAGYNPAYIPFQLVSELFWHLYAAFL